MEKNGAGGPGGRLFVEGGGVVHNGLNHIQRAVVVIVIGRKAGDGLDAIGGVAHSERVLHQLQHFGVVAAVANRHALLRRDVPAFQQAADTVSFMQAGRKWSAEL